MLSSLYSKGGDHSLNNLPVNSQSSQFCNTKRKVEKNDTLSPERKTFCQMGTVLFVM